MTEAVVNPQEQDAQQAEQRTAVQQARDAGVQPVIAFRVLGNFQHNAAQDLAL
jgi:hypothetical protein